MNRFIAALVCLVMLLCPAAPAETAEPESEAHAPAGTMQLVIGSEQFALEYDPSTEYSLYDGAYVQPSFFLYHPNADGSETLYEVYLSFPDDVLAGTTLSPEACAQPGYEDSSILLFITDDEEIYAVASQSEGMPYPAGSDYSIHFTEVSVSGTVYSYTGTFEASMVAVDDAFNPLYSLEPVSGSFSFSMDLGTVTPAPYTYEEPYSDETPVAPQATVPPAPATLVTPPDAKRI